MKKFLGILAVLLVCTVAMACTIKYKNTFNPQGGSPWVAYEVDPCGLFQQKFLDSQWDINGNGVHDDYFHWDPVNGAWTMACSGGGFWVLIFNGSGSYTFSFWMPPGQFPGVQIQTGTVAQVPVP